MRSSVLVALILCLAAAGCGSGKPHLARADVAPLIALSQQIARESPCAQKRDLPGVRARAIALVNRSAVPSDLQESFLAGVNDLANRTPNCVPPAPAPQIQAGGAQPGKPDHGKGHDKHQQREGD